MVFKIFQEDIRAEKNFSGVESATKANMFPASIVKVYRNRFINVLFFMSLGPLCHIDIFVYVYDSRGASFHDAFPFVTVTS